MNHEKTDLQNLFSDPWQYCYREQNQTQLVIELTQMHVSIKFSISWFRMRDGFRFMLLPDTIWGKLEHCSAILQQNPWMTPMISVLFRCHCYLLLKYYCFYQWKAWHRWREYICNAMLKTQPRKTITKKEHFSKFCNIEKKHVHNTTILQLTTVHDVV